MTSAESTTENERLSGNVLGIIGAYRMGAALDTQDLYVKKTAPEDPSPEPVLVLAESSRQLRRGGRR